MLKNLSLKTNFDVFDYNYEIIPFNNIFSRLD